MRYVMNFEEFRQKLHESEMNPNSEQAIKQRDNAENVAYFNTNKGKLDGVLKEHPDKWEEKATQIIANNAFMGIYWNLIKIKKQQADSQSRLNTADVADKELATQEVKHYTERAKELEVKLKEAMAEIQKASV